MCYIPYFYWLRSNLFNAVFAFINFRAHLRAAAIIVLYICAENPRMCPGAYLVFEPITVALIQTGCLLKCMCLLVFINQKFFRPCVCSTTVIETRGIHLRSIIYSDCCLSIVQPSRQDWLSLKQKPRILKGV